MIAFTLYDADTGRIIRSGRCSDLAHVALQSRANNEILLEGFFMEDTHYVVEHEARERPKLAATETFSVAGDDIHTVDIPVPSGTMVSLQGGPTVQIDDGLFSWGCAVPGVYRMTLEPPFPHQRLEMEVTVHAV